MNKVPIQPSLFPEYPQQWFAYEMEAIGGRWWEVYDDGITMIANVECDDFGDFLDFARTLNYDVHIFTYESWEAMNVH